MDFSIKKINLVLAASFLVASAYAQNSTQNEYEEWRPSQNEYTDFDIGKLFSPDIVRNQLDVNFDFRSDHSRQNFSYPDRDGKLESSNFAGNISSYFSHYENTRKRISILTGSVTISGDYSSLKDELTYSNDNLTNVDNLSNSFQRNYLYLNWSNQWYFSNLFFMHYGINNGISYNFKQNEIKNQSEDSNEKQKEFRTSISTRLGVGYGRIENVRDARQAVYIANALSKKKVLNRKLSDDELFELSQIISTVKNKRFLDSRLRLIEEIKTVDSFLEDNDLLVDNGATYFTTLYDMWQYGDLFSRRSGYELSFIVSHGHSYQNTKYTPVMRDVIYNYTNWPHVSLDFRYDKPFKLNWQHSLDATVFGSHASSYLQNRETGNDYKKNSAKHTRYSAYVNYSLGYYPNTRTNIQVTASQSITKDKYDDGIDSMWYSTMIGPNLYYYFSPNLRLTGECRFIYEPRRKKWNEGFYHNSNSISSLFNIQLTYSIF